MKKRGKDNQSSDASSAAADEKAAKQAVSFRTTSLIESFLEMLTAERNAAANTRLAYGRDLLDAAAFIAKNKSNLVDAWL